ncbi:unnamed protein product [Orchesella dallaii]|uniref:BRCT domain-containing protein n=1 Tax=Orchesella dallaii TaxID=48710 RepID=A0ABP1S159_9HEXA
MSARKRTTGTKPVAIAFFRKDDRFLAEYFTSVGFVNLWDAEEQWRDATARLNEERKGPNIGWLDVRRHWSVVDAFLEDHFNIELPSLANFGFSETMDMTRKFQIYTQRLHEAIRKLRKRSDELRIVKVVPKKPEQAGYKIKGLSMLPKRFESRQEGAECLDKAGLALPPQIFDGKRFYLLESMDTFNGLVCRTGLEYLIKLHGGRVVESLDGTSDSVCITSSDEARNRKFWNESPVNIYLPSLIYWHTEEKMFLTSMTMMDHVYLNGAYHPTEGRNTTVARAWVVQSESSDFGPDAEQPHVPPADTIPMEGVEPRSGPSQQVEEQVESAAGPSQPMEELDYRTYLDLEEVAVLEKDLVHVDCEVKGKAVALDAGPDKLKWALCFSLAAGAKNMHDLACKVHAEYNSRTGEKKSLAAARIWEKRVRANPDKVYSEVADNFRLDQGMLEAFKALQK